MSNKVLITGANKGIGFELARQLGLAGWKVLLGARSEVRGSTAVSTLQTQGVKSVEMVKIDLTDSATINSAAAYVKSKHADLNLLINNAGIAGDMKKNALDFTTAELREVFEVNFFGSFEMIKAFTPILKENHGRILNITMPTSPGPYFHPLAYQASKSPLNAIIENFGFDFEQNKIPVEIFGIMPGAVTTDLNGNMTGPWFKTAAQAGKVIIDLLTDGKNHQGKVLNEYGVAMNYEANYGLKE